VAREGAGAGGRQYRTSPEGIRYVDQNFDTYSVEYTYSDGAKFFSTGAPSRMPTDLFQLYARHQRIGDRLEGRRLRAAVKRVCKSGPDLQNALESKVKPDEQDPYQNEWNDLVDAIRDDRPYNEVQRGVEASLVSSMGRMAAHTARK